MNRLPDPASCAPRSAAGFTLLEVLIAILILSIGLLGLAGLQVAALRGTAQTYERSQAAAFATEMVDRMRANRVAAGEGRFNLEPFEVPAAELDCEVANCGRDQAAAFELAQWHSRLLATLPGATAAIEQLCLADVPCEQRSTHRIRVLWNEYRTRATDASCPDAANFDAALHLACVGMSVSP